VKVRDGSLAASRMVDILVPPAVVMPIPSQHRSCEFAVPGAAATDGGRNHIVWLVDEVGKVEMPQSAHLRSNFWPLLNNS
jgi:hypothetical protein